MNSCKPSCQTSFRCSSRFEVGSQDAAEEWHNDWWCAKTLRSGYLYPSFHRVSPVISSEDYTQPAVWGRSCENSARTRSFVKPWGAQCDDTIAANVSTCPVAETGGFFICWSCFEKTKNVFIGHSRTVYWHRFYSFDIKHVQMAVFDGRRCSRWPPPP